MYASPDAYHTVIMHSPKPPYPLWESLHLDSQVCDQDLMRYPGFLEPVPAIDG
jgi:hypothetical protein